MDPNGRPQLVEVLPRRPRGPRRYLLAIGAVAFVAVSAIGILQRPGAPVEERSPAPPTGQPPSASPTEPVVPAWALDLAGALDCARPPQRAGGEVGELDPVGGFDGPLPYPWLDAVDDVDLPFAGWREEPAVPWYGEDGFVRYVNEADGRVTAALVMEGDSTNAARGSWAVVAFRACRPDEFDPLRGRTTDDAPWVDAAGRTSERVRVSRGPAHCGWESTIWLRVDDRLYLRDPLGVLASAEVGEYLAATDLPIGARSTGFTSSGRELFETADADYVWVRRAGGVEGWPAVTTEPGCA